MVDVVVIGGGIAGVSAAARLAERGCTVTLVETEAPLAYHTTGRSAALYFENYGHPDVRSLSKASLSFFQSPGDGLADAPLLTSRGALMIAAEARTQEVLGQAEAAATQGTPVDVLDTGAALSLVPAIRPSAAALAIYEPGASDMDVAAIHQAFVRLARRHDAQILTSTPVTAVEPGLRWTLRAGDEKIEADVVVNAAGAWCDQIAAAAGIGGVGISPKRRTAFMVTAPGQSSGWPLVAEIKHDWYFKPDGPQLLCSPADETPSVPCDARPEEIDVAIAIERINQATTLGIRSVRSSWAGLRSFVEDGSMVIGEEPGSEGFYWLVGQGGTGIQTAPAAAQLVADGGFGIRQQCLLEVLVLPRPGDQPG